MSLTFPNIDPVAIAVGPVQIRWYALAYLTGILLAWAYARWIVSKDEARGLRPNKLDIEDFIPYAVLGVILGGRLGYILFYQPAYYFSHPAEILHVWNGGMSFHGGASGVIIALIVYSLVKKIDMWRLGDLAAASCTIGLFLGRIANFINGELYGRVTDVSWGVVFPSSGDGLARHPSQLYEAALEGLVLFSVLTLLFVNDRIRNTPGIIGGTFLIGYGLARMFVELFRQPDDYLGFVAGPFTMGQLLCIPMILIGSAFIVLALRRRSHVRNPA